MFCSAAYGLATMTGLSQSVLMVSISDAGSLDMAQWNLVRKVELMFRNDASAETA
jgi:hypothetical protein